GPPRRRAETDRVAGPGGGAAPPPPPRARSRRDHASGGLGGRRRHGPRDGRWHRGARPPPDAARGGLALRPAVVTRARGPAGREGTLELPLEPYGFPAVDPGPGVLLVSMTPEDVTRRTRRFLAGFPEVSGVATGMGSRFTEDRARMRAVLEAVRGEGRYFVDG